jgi:hypothetical protein
MPYSDNACKQKYAILDIRNGENPTEFLVFDVFCMYIKYFLFLLVKSTIDWIYAALATQFIFGARSVS